jgi:murein DD-endopeptidase MepM/ murein hydrolase activator NlpD
MHLGVQWTARIGTLVVSAEGVLVVYASSSGEYGRSIMIEHGGGWRRLYADLSLVSVRAGECVERGR